MINQLAAEKGKVAALTETGVDKVPNADWWTKYLLKALKHDKWSRKTAWTLVWRIQIKRTPLWPLPRAPQRTRLHRISKRSSHCLRIEGLIKIQSSYLFFLGGPP